MNYIKLGFVIQGNVRLMLYLPSHGEGKGGGTKYMCMGEISCQIGCRPLRREREREREGHWAGGGRGIFSCVKMIMEVLHQNLSVQGGMC